MSKILGWAPALAVLFWTSICPAGEIPHTLAGFVLGGELEAHTDKIKPKTVLPVRYLETLKEVETGDIWGYKTGLVSYTTCTSPSRIARLKFKYADASRDFYNALLKRFKKRFGEPDEYRGDPFHVVIAWKWSFIDQNKNDISLILQHNTRDDEEKQGNSVKMTMWNLLKDEVRCFEQNRPEASTRTPGDRFEYKSAKEIDWDLFVPH